MEVERKIPRNMIFEYFLPSSWWTETADSHCLLLDLPGFKKEEVRIRTDNYGHVIVRGERQADNTKILHFEQSYSVPEGCNIHDTSAILEDETYYIIIPKKINSKEENSEDRVSDGLDKLKRDEEEDPHPTGSEDESLLEKLLKKLKKKKRCLVLAAAFLAFSVGVVVSHRNYQSTTQVEVESS